MINYGFKKGYRKASQEDAPEIKERIMQALGITTRTGWWRRLNGIVEPKVSEAIEIEKIFAEYGITEVWDYEWGAIN